MMTARWGCLLTLIGLCAGAASAETVTLEWKLKKDQAFGFKLVSTIITEAGVGGARVTNRMECEAEGRLLVLETNEKGTGRAEITFTRLFVRNSTAGVPATNFNKGADSLKDRRVRGTLSRQGRLKLKEEDLEAFGDDLELAQHLADLFLQLPEKAVKKGDAWAAEVGEHEGKLVLEEIQVKEGRSLAVIAGGVGLRSTAKAEGGATLKVGTRVTGKLKGTFHLDEGYLATLEGEMQVVTQADVGGEKSLAGTSRKRSVTLTPAR